MTERNILLILLTLFLELTGSSQEPLSYNYTTANGLPSSQVYDITQDKWGYIWFSTDRGLCRYDGQSFQYYSTKDGLPDNTVFEFTPDPISGIWCTSVNNRIFHFEGEKPRFKQFHGNHTVSGVHSMNVLNQVAFDRDGNTYTQYLASEGYKKTGPDGELSDCPDAYPHNGLPDSIYSYSLPNTLTPFFFVSSVPVPNANLILRMGYHQFEFPTNLTKCENAKLNNRYFSIVGNYLVMSENGRIKNSVKFPSTLVHINVFDDSSIWVSSASSGLYIVDSNGAVLQNFLPGQFVLRLFKDNSGDIWISTLSKGVYHYRNNLIKTITINDVSAVTALCRDNTGNLYVGFQNGNIYSGKVNRFRQVFKSEKFWPATLCNDPATNITYFESDYSLRRTDEPSKIITSTQQMGNTMLNGRKDSGHYIFSNHSLFVLNGNKLRCISEGNRVNDVVEFNGQVIIASSDGLLIDSSGVLVPQNRSNPLLALRCEDLDLFNDRMAMATFGQGIVLYDGRNTEKIASAEGLSSDFVNVIYVEGGRTIWAGTNIGVSRVRFNPDNTYTVAKLSFADGLPGNEVTDIAMINDTVWVGTRSGLCYFHKGAVEEMDDKSTNYFLEIQDIYVNDSLRPVEDNLNLAYNENRVEIHYHAISFNEASNLRFRYKLEGLERNWKYTSNLFVTYSSLPPGSYKLVLQVREDHTDWSQTKSISFRIFPPFWKTWWFRISALTAITALVYLFFRLRILTYNRDIVREILRQILKRIRKKTYHIVIRSSGEDAKIATREIMYIKSEGNYLEIYTDKKKYVIREKISNFLDMVPDPLEFVRVRRSYIIRIDKVTKKGRKHIYVGDYRIDVGETYVDELEKIQL